MDFSEVPVETRSSGTKIGGGHGLVIAPKSAMDDSILPLNGSFGDKNVLRFQGALLRFTKNMSATLSRQYVRIRRAPSWSVIRRIRRSH